jgi:hypothetical protein
MKLVTLHKIKINIYHTDILNMDFIPYLNVQDILVVNHQQFMSQVHNYH